MWRPPIPHSASLERILLLVIAGKQLNLSILSIVFSPSHDRFPVDRVIIEMDFSRCRDWTLISQTAPLTGTWLGRLQLHLAKSTFCLTPATVIEIMALVKLGRMDSRKYISRRHLRALGISVGPLFWQFILNVHVLTSYEGGYDT